VNLLDSGAPFYEVYETADGKFVAVGALEGPFYSALLKGLGLDEDNLPPQLDQSSWPQLRLLFSERFRSRTRDQWCGIFDGTNACVTPVLSLAEAARHPHNVARQTFIEPGGVLQCSPVPRFSRTAPELHEPPPRPGEQSDAVLEACGFTVGEIAGLRQSGAIR
jgi:alpha-methylacyl-CoA racemase